MTYPEDFSGLGGNVRGFPSPGTLQDLDRWTEDSFWLDLLSVASPSSAERFRERSLAWETQTKDGQAARLRRPGLYQEDTVPRTRPEPPHRQEVKDLPPTELILSHLNIRKTLEGQNSVN